MQGYNFRATPHNVAATNILKQHTQPVKPVLLGRPLIPNLRLRPPELLSPHLAGLAPLKAQAEA